MAATVVLLALIVIFDYLPLIRARNIREITGYGVLLAAAFTLLSLHGLGVEIQSIPMMLNDFIKDTIGYAG
jgi:hypothetical protein